MTTDALEGRPVAAFRILELASKRTATREKTKPRERQNKTRSKLSKQEIASKSKYSESTFLRLEVGTIARVDAVLEKFEDRSHMLREAIEHEIERRNAKQRDR